MSLSKKIASNTLVHLLGKFSGSVVGLIIVGIMTRYLGTEGWGWFTTILSYLYFFSILGDLGLYLVAINELGRPEVDKFKIYSNAFTMRLVSGLVLMLLAGILIWFFPYPLVVKLGVLVAVLLVFSQMLDQMLVALFQVQMKTKFIALAEIVGKIVILILTLLVVKYHASFIYVVWAFVVGFCVHFLIDLCCARRLLKFKLSFDREVWQIILKKSWPIAAYMVFTMIYFKADTIILSLYHSASAVGIYGAPYKILEVLIVAPAIFMGLVSPHLSNAWAQKNLVYFKKIFQKAFDVLSIVVWPLILGTIVLAQPIINLIAGSAFAASVPLLQILIVATGIIFMAHLTTFAVVAIEQQKRMMKYYIIAAIAAVVLYFIFIPLYSYYAAAVITVLVELFILLASGLMIRKNTHINVNWQNNLKSLLISLIMAGVLYLTHFNLFFSIILGCLIYLSGLYLFGVLHRELILDFVKKE